MIGLIILGGGIMKNCQFTNTKPDLLPKFQSLCVLQVPSRLRVRAQQVPDRVRGHVQGQRAPPPPSRPLAEVHQRCVCMYDTFGGFHIRRPQNIVLFFYPSYLCPQNLNTIFPQICGTFSSPSSYMVIWKPPLTNVEMISAQN